jgi:uncharacterized protein (TIGR02246 family)
VDTSAIARSTAALLAAVNASDVAGVMSLWADDGVLMPPHHPSVHGRPQIERYFSELFQRLRFNFSFASSQIQLSGETAFERVHYNASAWPADGGPEIRDVGKGLHVYRRESDGSWKLVADIWNSDHPAIAGQ